MPVKAVLSPVTIMPLVHGPALGEKDVDTLGTPALLVLTKCTVTAAHTACRFH